MSKAKHKIVGILEYFRTAELPAAEMALALVRQAVIERRVPVATLAARKRGRPRKVKPAESSEVTA